MQTPTIFSRLPKHVWILVALYFLASLTHFIHNAEYIAFYPNMPGWITRAQVYLVWLAITSAGVIGIALLGLRLEIAAALILAAYGALGFYGLAHYTLALCSEHTLAMNLTIWFEVITGALLAVFALSHTKRLAVARLRAAAIYRESHFRP
jgi:hypothetical protein